MENKYSFYCSNGVNGGWDEQVAFVACNNEGGILFFKDGTSASYYLIPYYNEDSFKKDSHCLKITFNQAPRLIENHSKIELVKEILFYTLGVKEVKQIELTENLINKSIQNLKTARAFNEDSALKIEDENELEIYQSLSKKNIVNCFNNNKFYFSEKIS